MGFAEHPTRLHSGLVGLEGVVLHSFWLCGTGAAMGSLRIGRLRRYVVGAMKRLNLLGESEWCSSLDLWWWGSFKADGEIR